MKHVDDQQEFQKLVGMYFDQALDPASKVDFLRKVDTDPSCHQIFLHEQWIRENLKKRIYRPADSSQLLEAIRNQIGNERKDNPDPQDWIEPSMPLI